MLRTLGLCFGVLFVFIVTQAEAASLSISPIKIVLSPSGHATTVRISNKGETPALVQVEAVEWAEDLEDARTALDILVVPPVFEVPVNATQLLRLATRTPRSITSEEVYRLLLTEIPKDRQISPNALAFSVRLNLPLFVTPEGASASPEVSLTRGQQDEHQVLITNRGTAHLRVSEMTVAGHPVGEGATYVLAGESKSWPIGERLSALPGVVEVRAKTNYGALVSEVSNGGS